VFKVASSDLVNMGIGVVSYTLKDVHDDQVWPGWGSGCQEEELLLNLQHSRSLIVTYIQDMQ